MQQAEAEEAATGRLNFRVTPRDRRSVELLAVELAQRFRRPVSMSEAIKLAVNSTSAVLAAGGELPVALSSPTPQFDQAQPARPEDEPA